MAGSNFYACESAFVNFGGAEYHCRRSDICLDDPKLRVYHKQAKETPKVSGPVTGIGDGACSETPSDKSLMTHPVSKPATREKVPPFGSSSGSDTSHHSDAKGRQYAKEQRRSRACRKQTRAKRNVCKVESLVKTLATTSDAIDGDAGLYHTRPWSRKSMNVQLRMHSRPVPRGFRRRRQERKSAARECLADFLQVFWPCMASEVDGMMKAIRRWPRNDDQMDSLLSDTGAAVRKIACPKMSVAGSGQQKYI